MAVHQGFFTGANFADPSVRGLGSLKTLATAYAVSGLLSIALGYYRACGNGETSEGDLTLFPPYSTTGLTCGLRNV